MYIQV